MLISVIMPAYNAEEHIYDAIESVLAQLDDMSELIIVDDCSIDSTCEIVAKQIHGRSNTRLMKLDRNRGVSFARNYGVKFAKGLYVSFIDSDDVWLPFKMDRDVQIIKNNDVALLYSLGENSGARESVNEFMRRRRYIGSGRPGLLKRPMPYVLFGKYSVSTSNVVIKRDIVLKYPFKLNNSEYEDTMMWLLAANQGPLYFNDEVLSIINDRPSSLSASVKRSSVLVRVEMYKELFMIVSGVNRLYYAVALVFFTTRKVIGYVVRGKYKRAVDILKAI